MADLGEDFVAGETERVERNVGDPIPDKVVAIVHLTKTDLKETKNAKDGTTGKMFAGEMVVLDGPYEKRKHWPNIILANSNQDVAARGRTEFAEMCDGAGVAAVRNTDELLHLPFKVMFGVKLEADQRSIDPQTKKPVMRSRNFVRHYWKPNEGPDCTAEKVEPTYKPGIQKAASASTTPKAGGVKDWLKGGKAEKATS